MITQRWRRRELVSSQWSVMRCLRFALASIRKSCDGQPILGTSSMLTRRCFLSLLVLAGLPAADTSARAQPSTGLSEPDRIAVVRKVKPSVVAVFARGGQGGGTGVLISDDGYALTNFHVVAGPGPVMQCGLPDGVLYDA